jgi:hypothetical protein
MYEEKNLWFPYRRRISSTVTRISAELDFGSGYAGNEFDQTNTYSCLTQMPAPPRRPLHQWSLQSLRTLLPSGPRSTLIRNAAMAMTDRQHGSLTLCRPVTYILRVSDWLWQLRLSWFLYTNAVIQRCHSFPIHSHTTIRYHTALSAQTKQISLLQTPSTALQATQPAAARA